MKHYRALLLGVGLALLAALLTAEISEAKKPPKDPVYPDPPIQYKVIWLYGLADSTIERAIDINKAGIIVGNTIDAENNQTAVYWGPADTDAEDLNSQAGIPNGFYLFKAERINNDGLITGGYEYVDGARGVFVYDLNGLEGERFFYSNPIVIGQGSVYPKSTNLDGTVVGMFRRDDDSFGGFAWNYLHRGDVYTLPDKYLATDINDIDDDGNAEVVGAIEGKFYPNGDVFRWILNWAEGQFRSPADTASVIGLDSDYFPGPVINNEYMDENGYVDRDIVASIFWSERKNRGNSVSLLRSGDAEWTRLIRGVPWRIALNDGGQVTCWTTPFDDFHYGSVIVRGTVWGLDNPKIIDDAENEWFLDNALPEAAADESDASLNGFSPIVGWHYNGRALLLMPAEYQSE